MKPLNGSAVHVVRAVRDITAVWPQFVRQRSDTTLAHAAEWLTAIQRAYGHEPLYLMSDEGARHAGVLPAFVVRRPVFGTVVTSMPFLDAGGPCASSMELAEQLVDRLVSEARALNAASIELRCTQRLNLPVAPMEHKSTLTLDLPSNADGLWQQLDGSVRNQVRKAQRSGLTVEFGGAEKLDEFYAVFAIRMRELGSPVHGREFFASVFESFGSRARVALVRKQTTPVGGLVALACNDLLAVPWASCRREFFTMCPNMLLYWETIRNACLEGFKRFDFGRSTRGSGTYRFKRQWGAREAPLFWYSLPLHGVRRQPSLTGGHSAALLAGSWRHLPLAVTCFLGPRLRRYLTQ